jgi:hypothetical protein
LEADQGGDEAVPVPREAVGSYLGERALALDEHAVLEPLKGIVPRGERGVPHGEADGGAGLHVRVAGRVEDYEVVGEEEALLLAGVPQDGPVSTHSGVYPLTGGGKHGRQDSNLLPAL